MKKVVTVIVCLSAAQILTHPVLAERPVAEPLGPGKKVQTQGPVAADTQKLSAEMAAVNRLCQGLGRVKGNLQGLNASAAEYAKLNAKVSRASMEAKNKFLKPASATQSPVAEVQEIRKLNTQARDLKVNLSSKAARIREDWRLLESDMRLLSASRLTGAKERSCIARAQEELRREAEVLESQVNALKSQMGDRESSMSAMKIAEECNVCDVEGCNPCCARNFPVNQDESTPQGQEQRRKLARCQMDCKIGAEVCRASKERDDNTTSAWNTLMDVLKYHKEHSLSTVKNLTGI